METSDASREPSAEEYDTLIPVSEGYINLSAMLRACRTQGKRADMPHDHLEAILAAYRRKAEECVRESQRADEADNELFEERERYAALRDEVIALAGRGPHTPVTSLELLVLRLASRLRAERDGEGAT